MPGSFNPIHNGHVRMAAMASKKLECPCWFELSVVNADKGGPDRLEIAERLNQNFQNHGVLLSHAATFAEKSKLFPKAKFVVGADTILRIGDLKYYDRDSKNFEEAMNVIRNNGCQFLVFGRKIGNNFVDERNISLGESLFDMCIFINREQFESDLSSTSIRKSN